MIHKLKTWTEYFEKVLDGSKAFEIRENDRNYKKGDLLLLQEYNPIKKRYTGREVLVKVNYIFYGGKFGLEKKYCIMSIERIEN
jgi:hypothetical protein